MRLRARVICLASILLLAAGQQPFVGDFGREQTLGIEIAPAVALRKRFELAVAGAHIGLIDRVGFHGNFRVEHRFLRRYG